jgi:Tol biopolymer transport system component
VDYTLAASAAGATPVTSRPFENVAPPQGEIAFVGGRPAAPEIFVVHTDGSGLRRLASGDHPAWSPDGARLAFTSGPIGEGEVVYYTNGQVALVNADGSGLAILGRGAHPAWSPDGSRIAFTSSADWETTQRSDIYVMNTDGSGLAALNETVFEGVLPWAEQPAWSPDGNTIAFVASPDVENLPSRMYAMNPDGSNVRSLPQPDDRPWVLTQCCVSWSPDGTRFLFWSWMRGWRVMRSDGAGGADALPADPEWTSRPAWSPDGRWMAQTIRGQLTLSYGDRVIRIPIGHSGRNPAWRPAHADGGQVP